MESNQKISLWRQNGTKIGEFDKVDVLTQLIVGDKKDVYFFGEGNFTLPLALAVLRGKSWDGITVSFYESDTPDEIKSTTDGLGGVDLDKVKVIAKTDIPSSSKQAIDEVPDLKQLQPTIYYRVDVTEFTRWGSKEGAFWFQCPWAFEAGNPNAVLDLLRGFMEKTGVWLESGSYLLIGITAHPDYVERYKLDILNNPRPDKGDYNYNKDFKFIGGDTRLINTLIQYGYHHKAHEVDIHEYIKKTQVILVFQKH